MGRPSKSEYWSSWGATPDLQRNAHVYPVEDWIEHKLDGQDCICGPKVERTENGAIVSHRRIGDREEN